MFLVAVLGLGIASGSAATIYSTLGATITGGDGHFTDPAGLWVANYFDVSAETTVDQYRVAVVAFGDTNTGVLSLWSGAAEPTTLVEPGIPFSIPQSPPTGEGWEVVTVPSVTNPSLAPGETYWVVLYGNGGDTSFNWWYVSQSGTQRLGATGGASWYYKGNVPNGFEVQGTVVPEPATLWVLALGGLALIRRRRRMA
jgi:hypothetical protein